MSASQLSCDACGMTTHPSRLRKPNRSAYPDVAGFVKLLCDACDTRFERNAQRERERDARFMAAREARKQQRLVPLEHAPPERARIAFRSHECGAGSAP